MKAHVVVDLGFGDAGKGLLTDWLVRTAGANLVVRFNGGAQAGHNVVAPDGRHHTFAQFGAGTLAGAATFLSRTMIVHPTALLVEAAALAGIGVRAPLDRVWVSERARVTTPFHQAANRLREAARGASRHGSVGVGVGETVADALASPADAIVAGDLRTLAVARKKLARLRERKRVALQSMKGHPEWEYFEDESLAERWLEHAATLAPRITADEALSSRMRASTGVVFEGAQGILLDERLGFHPYTTWSTCTDENALALLAEFGPTLDVETIGVIRTHMVRHGAGPLPTEVPALSVVEHNATHPWQGRVRYGWFDAVLVRYALASLRTKPTLAITHADAPRPWRACRAWSVDGEPITTLVAPAHEPSGEAPSPLTRAAERAEPIFVAEDATAEPLETIAGLLETRPAIVSRGPTAADVSRLP